MDHNPEKYRYDLEIIRETAQQVIRDLSIHHYDIIFSGNEMTAYNELTSQLKPVIDEMYKTNRNGFRALLYQIDISESSFRKLVLQTSAEEFSLRLSEMIVQREFQKVLTRRFFRESD